MHFSITKNPNGCYDVEPVQIPTDHEPTKREKMDAILAAKAASREEVIPLRRINPEDTALHSTVVQCPHCDYLGKNAQGLSSHIRNRHK